MDRCSFWSAYVQLDLFIPYEYGHDELKSQTQMDYIPTRRRAGTQGFVLTVMLAQNPNREMQMMAGARQRNTTERRAPLWQFQQLGTLRRKKKANRAYYCELQCKLVGATFF